MTAEERIENALKFEIESVKPQSSARSVLSKALKRIADEQGVKLSQSAADTVAELTILTFFKKTIENEKSIVHIQLEKEYRKLENDFADMTERYQRSMREYEQYKRICAGIAEKKNELVELQKKCKELEEITKLKSTDARLYGARCAYEFAYQKTKNDAIALKSFNSYLLGGATNDKPVEEFDIIEVSERKEKLERW